MSLYGKKVYTRPDISARKPVFILDDRIIKSCKQHIEEAITGSTRFYFAKNSFFQELPPKTRQKVVEMVLVNERKTFAFFFEDFIGKRKAPAMFIYNVLTNLTSSIYSPGDVIYRFGEKIRKLIVISSGQCNLFKQNTPLSPDEDKIKSQKILLAILPERSWYGDFQIFHDLDSIT